MIYCEPATARQIFGRNNDLGKEASSIQTKLNILKRKGFYANYASITSLNNELKKIKSKIETMKVNISAGAYQKTQREIKKHDKGFEAEYRLVVYELQKHQFS